MKKIIEEVFTHAERTPAKIALQMKGEQGITYRDLKAQILLIKDRLAPFVNKPGARVVLLGFSSPEWIMSFLGIILAGGTVVPIDPNLEESHLEKLILRSEPHALFISEEIRQKYSTRLTSLCPTMIMDQDFKLVNEKNEITPMFDDHNPEVAALLFTSGTTGDYKGVLLSQKSFDQAVNAAINAVPLSVDDVIMCVLPAHHIFGLVCVLLVPLAVGAKVVFIKKLQGVEMVDAMQTYHPTVLVAVPRLLELLYGRITGQAKVKGRLIHGVFQSMVKLNSWIYSIDRVFGTEVTMSVGKALFGKVHHIFGGKLTKIISGGAPLSRKLYNFFSHLGFMIIEGYGMTETTALVAANRRKTRMPGTVGEIVQGVEIKLLGEDEKGEGEICVRGDSITMGYFRDQEATENSYAEKWFRTGDIGHLDHKNRLVITGRIKEMIILPSGKNVSPDSVEQHYQEIPFVQEIAVYGTPISPGSPEEEIHAAIVINPEKVNPEDLVSIKQNIYQDFLLRSKSLPSWWQIKKIHFVESLPKTTSLKVKRKQLKELENEESK